MPWYKSPAFWLAAVTVLTIVLWPYPYILWERVRNMLARRIGRKLRLTLYMPAGNIDLLERVHRLHEKSFGQSWELAEVVAYSTAIHFIIAEEHLAGGTIFVRKKDGTLEALEFALEPQPAVV